jgi:Family of unknown function (DUF6221)
MTDIIAFLHARLDEDERMARDTKNTKWDGTSSVLDERGTYVAVGPYGCEMDEDCVAHITRWDPTRVLAETEAKRVVLDVLARCANVKWTGTYAVVEEARRALHALALPYVDHPNYDTAWRPVSNTV